MSARKIAYNTIVQFAGKFLGFFISSFFIIILAANLGTRGMGMYTTVTAFVAFFVTLGDLGVNLVMMRELAQRPKERDTIIGQFLGFRLLFSFLVMALAPLLAMAIPQYKGIIAAGVAVAALTQFVLLINQAFVSILQVNLKLDRAVIAEIVNRVVTLGLVVWLAQRIQSTEQFFFGVLWITVIAALANVAFSFFFARAYGSLRPRLDWGEMRRIGKLLAPMATFTFLGLVHFKADTIILSLMKDSYDVGIYGYAYKIGEILFSLPLMFIGVVFPQMSALYAGDKPGFLTLCQKAFRVLLLLSFPFIIGVWLLAPFLTTILSRQSVTDGLLAGQVLQILAVALVAWFFSALYQHILLAGTEYKGLIRNLSIAVVINITLNLIFIPMYSYFAAATITVITEIVALALTIVYVGHHMDFRAQLKGVLPMIVAALAMGAVLVGALNLLAIDFAAFAVASRFYQLVLLLGLCALGAAAYGGVLMLWGKQSPLLEFKEVIQR